MFTELFKFFSSSKNDKPKTYSPGHLVMQTMYGAPNSASTTIATDVTSLQAALSTTTNSDVDVIKAPDQNMLAAQTLALKKIPDYANAEISVDSLTNGNLLIGFTRHLKAVRNGIIMYPTTVRYTDQWDAIKEQAKSQKTNIAFFRPTSSIECLKVVNPAGTDQYHYLVDHRFLTRERSLLQFDKPTTDVGNANENVASIKSPAR